ncbi:hypothetical protein BJ944DRAFT_263193 [Cunninghamella echinulata]|nr:hypothetical protein BJ944DRAFT_263193 [Cunninghamella echinulata]
MVFCMHLYIYISVINGYIVVQDRKPCYRRPPARMYMDSVRNLTQTSSLINITNKGPSLSQLVTNGKNNTTSSLSQLRNKMSATPTTSNPLTTLSAQSKIKPASLSALASNTKPTSLSALASKTKPSSLSSIANNSSTNNINNNDNSDSKQSTRGSLLSLAQNSANQRNKSALQNLVQRQQNTPPSSPLTNLTNKKTVSLNGSNLSSLSRLATRSNQPINTNKLSSLVSSSPSSAASGLSSLLPKTEKKVSESKIKEEMMEKKDTTPTMKENQEEAGKGKGSTIVDQMASLYNNDITAKTNVKNPLIAPPSSAAIFLFKPHEKIQSSSSLSSDIFMTLPQTLGQAFYDTMSTTVTSKTAKLFNFDVPSPDDIVLSAQSHRSGQGKN